jgi:threonylcarbamoyladenosine tRNA methylthiotransferase MtaB
VRRAAHEQSRLRSLVMGCAAALDDERPAALRARALPTVEHVIGGADLAAIARALELELPAGALTHRQTGTRALLRVQDGCDEHCTFCATTLARGANRSRQVDDLVREAATLARVHAEIVITGIHIGTYGRDIDSSLAALMQRLVRDVPSARFRLSSIEATEVDESLVDLLGDAPRHLAPHVHAPLQSGSDRLLRRMGRHWYTSATYSEAVEQLAGRVPVLGLGADVIAGFPGETEDDHAATLALAARLPFTYLHVFPYSPRPGTAAEKLPDVVPADVAHRRAAELRAVGDAKAAAYRASRVDDRADVIVLGEGRTRSGMTEDFLTVGVDDPTLGRNERFAARLVARDGGGLSCHPVRSEGPAALSS